ncbi:MULTISPECIES: hypothetical protein [unclassified Streptomyces]|uniref:hypothetical protein n=1 Tax=unclassified Streptomyces TaxID=2593676 RepID=UPI00364840D1
MQQRRSWVWTFLLSREGMWSLLATTAAALALGLLPNLVQAVPVVGDSLFGLMTVAMLAVLLVAWATHVLRSKEGVGIVIYLGANSHWDRTRLREMQDDALQRHAACFVVEPDALLGGIEVSDRVAFAYRVMQARLEEQTIGAGEAPESVSFYVTARHADAYRLGGMLRAQLHENVSVFAESPGEEESDRRHLRVPAPRRRIIALVMGQSEERGRSSFPSVRLDSSLKLPPGESDLLRLRDAFAAPGQEPSWHQFTASSGTGTTAGLRPNRIALIVALSDNEGLVRDALCAAERGASEVYVLPGQAQRGDPEGNRCIGALVIRTQPGNIPDTTEHHEAFVRYVVHHWRRTVEEHGADATNWLFTDGPATFVLTLGALLGRRTVLVPLADRPRPATS